MRETEEKMEVESSNSAQALDLNCIRSRIQELKDIRSNFEEVPQLNSSEVDELVKSCAQQLESKVDQIFSDTSDILSLSLNDLDDFLDHLKKELSSVEEENKKVEEECEELSRRYVEDSSKLESELGQLSCSLEVHELKVFDSGKYRGKSHLNVNHHSSSSDGDGGDLLNPCRTCKIKILELDHLIEKKKDTLKSLEDLDYKFRRLETIEKIENLLSCLKVVEYEGNCIRLSLKTFIPDIRSILSLQRMEDLIEKPLEQNHELLLELGDGTMELKKVENYFYTVDNPKVASFRWIFPNDVYIGEIIDATKEFRQLDAPLPVVESRSSLEWFVRRVQDRIVLSTLRRFLVKCENKSRYSLEYLDRDEIVIAHLVGGIDASIKVAQGWPISDAPLVLITLKSPINASREISLSFLRKVVELGNSLDAHVRRSISSFVDGIEEILVHQM